LSLKTADTDQFMWKPCMLNKTDMHAPTQDKIIQVLNNLKV